MIHYITSKTNARIKELCSLKDSVIRKEKGLFLIEGFHLLEMAYHAHALLSVITLKPLESIKEIEQIVVTTEILKKISTTVSPQGVIGVCKSFPDFPEIVEGKVVYLDDVQDPGNVGTLIRTAVAFSFDLVILSEKCASLYNDKVISASQGAIFKIKIREGAVSDIEKYKQKGYQIIVTALDNAKELSQVPLRENVMLVLGNEAHGVQQGIKELATDLVKIKIAGIDSLNVAVAGGIFMNAITRK